MASADDRKTWISTEAPVVSRLEFRADPAVRAILDGAWWPRSRDAVAELTNLITALDARHTPVTRIMLNPGAWGSHPRRLGVAGRTVRLGWFTTLDASLLIATTSSDQRVDLLVVSPDAPPASAQTAITMACDGDVTLRATAIVTAVSAEKPTQSASKPRAKAVGAAKGGRVNGHRSRNPAG
jgi:hypothetical protein